MDDTQETISVVSRELRTLRPGSCKKRVETERQKQTVAANGQLNTAVVTGSSEK
jgi:hypothetical protein